MNVRYTWIEQAIEAFDETVDFNAKLIRTHYGAVNCSVESRRIAASGENTNAFHSSGRNRLFILTR
jgi:hypothetical protein